MDGNDFEHGDLVRATWGSRENRRPATYSTLTPTERAWLRQEVAGCGRLAADISAALHLMPGQV